jgi:hypothetical protein
MHTLIVGVMKPQIATGTRGVASAYGDVLFRAWKDANSHSHSHSHGKGGNLTGKNLTDLLTD